jgi:predicted ATPase/class 3 adenylate cyclase
MSSSQSIPEDFAAKLRAAREKRSMQGERRVVTILFTDVKGSTEMAGRLDPEDWAEVMNEAFDYLVAPIYRYEGTVARLMGDAVLAFFGAPIAHEDDPIRAVYAGLEILEGIQPFCQQVSDQYQLEFNVRVGINTGPVVVGEIGSDLAMEYTAMGDAANLAARMEETAEPGTIQISEHTHRLVNPVFETEFLGKIDIKGFEKPERAYRIIRSKDVPGSLRGIEGLRSPLVGRSSEIEAAQAKLGELDDGRGGILAILGEAGLGKTRLIDELKAGWLRENPADRWTESRALSFDRGKPYALFLEHIHSDLGIQPSDTPDKIRQKIAHSLLDYPQDERQLLQQAVELLLSVADEDSGIVVEGEAVKRELTESMLNAWKQAALQGPLVMAFDDLHWADSTSVDMLQSLFRLTDEAPILIICSMRPHRASPGWQVKLAGETNFPHRYTEVDLSPLSGDESDMLISNLLSIADLPSKVSVLIQEKAEGNPLFVEEVIRTLIDSNAIIRDETTGTWKSTSTIESFDLPDNLQALLVSRIDRLDQEIRRSLQLAAVIGRSFYFRILQRIAEAADALMYHMNTLQRVELIREEARIPELKYVFSHELTRDAAYQTILKRERREFHMKVGEAIETLFPDKLEEEAHLLAVHFRAAEDRERALKYFQLAGDAAARLHANAEAITHYTQAIELTEEDDVERMLNLYRHRGRAYEVSGMYDEALANYEQLEELGKKRGQPSYELAGLVARGTIYSTPTAKVDLALGRKLSEQALTLAEEHPNPRVQSKALWNLMSVAANLEGDANAAIEFGEKSLEIARKYKLQEQIAFTLHDLNTPYYMGGSPDKAEEALAESRELWKEMNNLPMLADNLTSASLLSLIWGRSQEADQLSREGLEISRKAGNLWGQSYSLMTLGWKELEVGNVSSGIAALEESSELAPSAGFLYAKVTNSLFLAWEFAMLGDVERGRKYMEGLTSADIHLPELETQIGVFNAYFSLMDGDARAAEDALAELAFDMTPGGLSGPTTIIGMAIAGEIALANRDYQLALQRSEPIVDTMKQFKVGILLPDILSIQGLALIGLENVGEGRQMLAEAVELAKKSVSRRGLMNILPKIINAEEQYGTSERVAEFSALAAEVLSYITYQIEDEDLQRRFLAMPGMQRFFGDDSI